MEPQEVVEPNKRILLVEDNEVLGDIYLRRFELEGFTAQLVKRGEEVLPATIEFKPDLILLDQMLPGENGLTALTKLRDSPETKHVKVFVFSALDQPVDRERALKLGADEYLVKTKDMLLDVIDRVRSEFGMPLNHQEDVEEPTTSPFKGML